MNYNFKSIKTIPASKDFINIILSKTQRKTPTVVHPGYAIGRIRGFYMRKIKFTQESVHDKFNDILTGFPKLDDIHPFFSDLINVLYDKDHYKLALGHIHSCMNLVDNVCKDYVRLIKYADSLYRCKQLKKACFGRICTIIKKLNSSLNYLEEVRKHLARLPSINPFERTILITGYPNVGKSSFINSITSANVEVQSYPFTTQSLYVGHTDYEKVRWQVIDSPGILDHSLEQRNTIEMQSITALAHLKACILFIIDISEQCGYSIQQQVKLFDSIKPLFKNKPLCIVLSKIDLKTFNNLSIEDQNLINDLVEKNNAQLVSMSCKTGENIQEVKTTACETLLKFRDGQKIESIAGGNLNIKREEQFLRGLYIANPSKIRNSSTLRTPVIPQSVLQGLKYEKPTLKDIQEEHGGAGVFNFPLQEHFKLAKDEWKYDVVPEIMEGKNIADFVDPDILEKLEELEKEENMLEQARLLNEEINDEEENIDDEVLDAHKQIVSKKTILKLQHKLNRHKTAHLQKNNTLENLKQKLSQKGINSKNVEERVNKKRKARRLTDQMINEDNDEDLMQDENDHNKLVKSVKNKKKSLSRSRSKGVDPNPINTTEEKAMQRLKHKIDKQWNGRAGEADRSVIIKTPKHLFSGKRKQKTDYR
ncbi:hypothetical protein IMG5_170120 [Ichthyophthirius multifiliis]|uniref:Nucleolar GTP-binding protein 1 n=1 Tax=Ichthyophthirius multifiliis TaxID=5932 RepID=G0R1F5_ICHMU|nr:hypothetical protein IMG5_170120 [Ichthyophthirius multifiliis]EGR28712.1 hypothetical protein IMG5_170120 [Ichthyophthirius multifiliis]|eukprot:XP_004029948.1 hypothetical protein IMG5_170120 [Ichthyophthirius multifiliis]